MKFHVGMKIQTRGMIPSYGVIIAHHWNSINREDDIIVRWDTGAEGSYNEDEANRHIEEDTRLPKGFPQEHADAALDTYRYFIQFGTKDQSGNLAIGCNHKWRFYHGLFDMYEFCELCDEKRNS